MGDAEPLFNQKDISDANGPVTTTVDGALVRLDVNDKKKPSDSPGSPTISTKLRHDFSESDVTITTAFTTMFSYTGTGKLFEGHFVLSTPGNTLQFKLTVDSNTIFDYTIQNLLDLDFNKAGELSRRWIFINNNKKIVGFNFGNDSLLFGTDVKVEAKTSSGTTTMTRRTVILTKET